MVVGELLVAMRDTKLVQPPHEPASTVQQIELILLAAVDVERLQPAEVIGLSFDHDDRVLPQPIRPAFLDDLASVERDRQPDPKELRRVRVPGAIRSLIGTTGARGFVEIALPLYNGALTRMKPAGRGVGGE